MKLLKITSLLVVASVITACSQSGWDGMVFRDTVTPGVHAETSERTWDNDGKPHLNKVQSEPAYLYDAQADAAQQ